MKNQKEQILEKIITDYKDNIITPRIPLIANIEITNKCPVNPPCIMCSRSNNWWIRKHLYKKEMSASLIEKLGTQLKGVKHLGFVGNGEPFASTRIFKLINSLDKDCPVRVISNGVLLNDLLIDKIVDCNIEEINFSLDAANEQTYSKLRGPHFSRIIRNIGKLVEQKNKAKKKLELSMNMTLMELNKDQIIPFVELASSIGVKKVKMHRLLKYNVTKTDRKNFKYRFEEQKIDTTTKEFNNYLDNCIDFAKEHDVKFVWQSPRDKKQATCIRPWIRLIILVNGDVQICWHNRTILGNLNNDSLDSIMNSKKAKRIMTNFLQQGKDTACSCKKERDPIKLLDQTAIIKELC